MKLAIGVTVFAAMMWVASSFAYPQANKTLAANPNYGKADDYGSERFGMINHCMVANLAADAKDKVSVEVCMNDNGFAFCPDCKIFGNKGPRCLDQDHLHSWCWVKDDER